MGKEPIDDILDTEENVSATVSEEEFTEDTAEVVSPLNEYRFTRLTSEQGGRKKLTGMYKEWFLDYASYVILERAVPHLMDGLKPVQRRILHSMKKMDDGRYNKVANIIGNTMQYHPHGDRSIGDALVQLGQKDLLIDCQGNWGNVLTGDSAAAPRYIEARLSKFALDVAFNAKTTEWMATYDGRNMEPLTLPMKFPLLLAQGGEGIAVGLASKILPHNFIELIDAAVCHLKGEPFELYPDFPTGGMIDVSRYNDGLRGGAVRVRSKIVKIDKKNIAVTEIPFGKTTTTIIESIVKANDKNKIKIKRVDDNTAQNVEIAIQLGGDVSADKTIDALYAFTDCEVSISPNACVILDEKPRFMGVSDILRQSVVETKELLKRELEIELHELGEDWHMSSLEKLFIEKRIYYKIEECTTWESVLETIDRELEPYKKLFFREITTDDIVKLTEIKIKRISKFDTFKANEHIKSIEEQIAVVKNHLSNLVEFAIAYYNKIKQKYGKGKERRSEIRSFGTIEAVKVAVSNSKLYVNREEGFFGIGAAMKKDEFVCDCSDIDEVIVITRSGDYIITKVSEKAYFEKDIIYIGIFVKNDERTIYNILYRDGANGAILVKRCAIKSITRDRVYSLGKGTPMSEVLYLSVNSNGEAEVVKVYFKQRARLKKSIVDLDFSDILIKGRPSQGNLFTRNPIYKIVLKEKGVSTLGGHSIWFDEDERRLNTEGRGRLLGVFEGADKCVVFTKRGTFYTTDYDVSLHFPDDILLIEKYNLNKVYSLTYFDASQKLFYVKRFVAEISEREQIIIDESEGSYLVELSSDKFPLLELSFAGANSGRPLEQIDVEEFIGVKGFKAKGKRVSAYTVDKVTFGEPLEKEIIEEENESEEGIEPTDEDSLEGPQEQSKHATSTKPETETTFEQEEEAECKQLSLFDDI